MFKLYRYDIILEDILSSMNQEKKPNFSSIIFPVTFAALPSLLVLASRHLGMNLSPDVQSTFKTVLTTAPVILTLLNIGYTLYEAAHVKSEDLDHYVPGRSLANRRMERVLKTAAGAVCTAASAYTAIQPFITAL